MAGPKWTKTVRDETLLPINLHHAKAYVLGDVEYNANHWTRVFTIDDEPVVIRVRQRQPLTKNITIRYEADFEPSEEELRALTEKVRYEIGADETLNPLREIQSEDILVKIALKNNAGLRIYSNTNTIETAICAIMQQNVDYTSYLEILNDFVSTYGQQVRWEPRLHIFPSSEVIDEMTIENWEGLGVGLKAQYLGGLNKRSLKNLHIYAYYPVYDRGIEGLMHIDGIGEYTARIIMIYAARRYEKAFMDGYVQEILDHKYKLHQVLPLSELDQWFASRWPDQPALVLHTHIQDYLPAYIRDFDFESIGRSTN